MPGFKMNRLDGRSMTDVIIDLFKDAKPETVLDYKSIIRALNTGAAKTHLVSDARGAVQKAKARLSRDYQRALRNIPGKGYKVAAACEHREIAMTHKTKSDRQLSRGLQTLQNVRWSELSPEARQAHEGTLLLVSALHEQQGWMDRRLKKVETMIHKISGQG